MNLKDEHDKHTAWKDELPWKAWGSWFSWGSPVGLSIFFLSIGILVVLFRYAFVIIH